MSASGNLVAAAGLRRAASKPFPRLLAIAGLSSRRRPAAPRTHRQAFWKVDGWEGAAASLLGDGVQLEEVVTEGVAGRFISLSFLSTVPGAALLRHAPEPCLGASCYRLKPL